jgi:hypothetical protein
MTDMYSRADTNSGLVVGDYTTWAHAVSANDDAGQFTGATYTNWTDSPNSTGEPYRYDDAGDRITANGDAYTTGDDNQTTSDGMYSYLFDDEGNRIAVSGSGGGSSGGAAGASGSRQKCETVR